MRLINASTLELEEFPDEQSLPPYAILSHTWGPPNEEVSFQDITNGSDKQVKSALSKIRNTCKQALKHG